MAQKVSVKYKQIKTSASYAALDAVVSYQNVAVPEFILDADTKNRYFRSGTEATMLEAHAALFGKAATDSFAPADQIDSFGFTKVVADSFGVTEDIHVLLEILRTFTENVPVIDSQAFAFALSKTDSVSTSDVEIRDFSKAATDSYALLEAAALSFSNVYSDSTSVTDEFSQVTSYVRAFSDTFTLDDITDVDAVQKNTIAAKTNVIGFADVQVFGTEKALQDTASVAEQAALHPSRPEADGISASDVFQKVVAFSRAPAEIVSVAESAVADVSKSLTDTPAVADVFQKAVSFQRVFTEALSFADQHVANVGKGFSDTTSMSETIQIQTRSIASSVLNAGVLNSAPLNN
jgi:hypothetical protein